MRAFLITILTTTLTFASIAQSSVSFQHLGNGTFQNTLLNPSLIPEGDIFIGLPVLSGIHFNVSSPLSYNDAISKEAGEQIVSRNKVLSNLGAQNLTMGHVNINLLQLGFKTKNGALFSFTANERIEADLLYSRDLINFLWNGSQEFVNEKVNFARIGLRATHFREFALGYATPVNEQLTVGLKGKFLMGFFDASTPANAKADLDISGEIFQIDADYSNAMLRTSGLNIYQGDPVNGQDIPLGSHLAFNSNTGFAIDLAGTYKLNKYYTLTGALLDVGFISWKEDIENHALNDTTFRYDGVSLRDISDVRQVLEDSLLDNFKTTENNDPYKSWLPLRAHGSWIYHFSPKTDFYVTVGTRRVQRQFKMMYGGGMTHKFGKVFTASVSATKLPNQFFNAGAAFTLKGGPVQMYMAADQVINFSAPDFKAFDFRFGMSFVINRKADDSNESTFQVGNPRKGAKGYDTHYFLGKSVKTKKREGIYSIIKKQKRRELKQKKTQSQLDNTQSINKRDLKGQKSEPKPVETKSINKRDLKGKKSGSKQVETKSVTKRKKKN